MNMKRWLKIGIAFLFASILLSCTPQYYGKGAYPRPSVQQYEICFVDVYTDYITCGYYSYTSWKHYSRYSLRHMGAYRYYLYHDNWVSARGHHIVVVPPIKPTVRQAVPRGGTQYKETPSQAPATRQAVPRREVATPAPPTATKRQPVVRTPPTASPRQPVVRPPAATAPRQPQVQRAPQAAPRQPQVQRAPPTRKTTPPPVRRPIPPRTGGGSGNGG